MQHSVVRPASTSGVDARRTQQVCQARAGKGTEAGLGDDHISRLRLRPDKIRAPRALDTARCCRAAFRRTSARACSSRTKNSGTPALRAASASSAAFANAAWAAVMSLPCRAIAPSGAAKSTCMSISSKAVRCGALRSSESLAQAGQDFPARHPQATVIVVIDEHQAVDVAVTQELLDLGSAGLGACPPRSGS